MTVIPFPELNESQADAQGVLATWYVTDGDKVTAGQLLADVQVDKVDAEVVAPSDGTVRLLVAEGDAVPQGVAIARVE